MEMDDCDDECRHTMETLQCVAFPFLRTLHYFATRNHRAKFSVIPFRRNHTHVDNQKTCRDPIAALCVFAREHPRIRKVLLHNTSGSAADGHNIWRSFTFYPRHLDLYSDAGKPGAYLRMKRHGIEVMLRQDAVSPILVAVSEYQSYVMSMFQWMFNVTDASSKALVRSDPETASLLRAYKGAFYSEINGYLRNGVPKLHGYIHDENIPKLNKIVAKFIEVISMNRWVQPPNGLLKCLRGNYLAFRTLYGDIAKKIIKGEINVVPNKAFSSFALDPTYGLQLADNADDAIVLIACKVRTGTPFCFLDGIVAQTKNLRGVFQSELLFAPGITIEIEKVTPRPIRCLRDFRCGGGRRNFMSVYVAFGAI